MGADDLFFFLAQQSQIIYPTFFPNNLRGATSCLTRCAYSKRGTAFDAKFKKSKCVTTPVQWSLSSTTATNSSVSKMREIKPSNVVDLSLRNVLKRAFSTGSFKLKFWLTTFFVKCFKAKKPASRLQKKKTKPFYSNYGNCLALR